MNKLKRLIFISMMLLMCACGQKEWEDKITFSNLDYKDNTITGEVENLTDNKYDLTITLELKEDDSIQEEVCMFKIDPKETEQLECKTTKYIAGECEIKVIDVKFEKKKTREEMNFQNEQELTDEELKEYFSDIYEQHVEIAADLFSDGVYGEPYPYLSKVTYYDDSIKILYVSGDFSIYLSEEYDLATDEIKTMYLNLTTNDKELVKSYRNKYANLEKFKGNLEETSLEEMLTEVTPNGSCYQVGNFCHLYQAEDDSHTFFTTHI